MNTLIIENNDSTRLVPSQEIVELLRISYLHLHHEDDKKSSKFDEMVRIDFLNSFSHAVDEFSWKLRTTGKQKIILINEFWYIDAEFLKKVCWYVNPPRIYKDEFCNELHICLLEHASRNPIGMKDSEIHIEDWNIVLSLWEASIWKNTSLVQENTMQALEGIVM